MNKKTFFNFLHFNFHSSNFCAIILDMDKSTLQTIAIIATVVVASWAIGGQVQANSAAIADLRDDMRELRGLLVSHIAGHNHVPTVTDGSYKEETQ